MASKYEYKLSAQYVNADERVKTVSAQAISQETGQALLVAVAATMSGTAIVGSGKVTNTLKSVTAYPPHAASDYKDAILTVKKISDVEGVVSQTDTIEIKNMSIAYLLAGSNTGELDKTNAALMLIASSHFDSKGGNGYLLQYGFFVD